MTLARVLLVESSGRKVDWKVLRVEQDKRKYEPHVALLTSLLVTGEDTGPKLEEEIRNRL